MVAIAKFKSKIITKNSYCCVTIAGSRNVGKLIDKFGDCWNQLLAALLNSVKFSSHGSYVYVATKYICTYVVLLTCASMV